MTEYHFTVTIVLHAGIMATAFRKLRRLMTLAFGEMDEEWTLTGAAKIHKGKHEDFSSELRDELVEASNNE